MTYCDKFPCNEIDCEGCKDNHKWCDDPRCTPHCRGCELPEGHDQGSHLLFATIVGILLFMILGMMVVYGPRYVSYHDGNKEEEYIVDNTILFGAND